MKLSENLVEAFNRQMAMEFQASFSYLAACAHFESTPFKGFAKWYRLQSEEEYAHAMRLFDYLKSRGATIVVPIIEQPGQSFDPKPIGVFKMSLAQEEAVSKAINELYELAQKERDYPSLQFLDWFLREQVEEEDSVTEVIDRLELVGDDPAGLLQIDAEAAARSPEEGGSGAAAG
ncbi:MAG: ferritin [Verrucomicrobiales bacterium]